MANRLAISAVTGLGAACAAGCGVDVALNAGVATVVSVEAVGAGMLTAEMVSVESLPPAVVLADVVGDVVAETVGWLTACAVAVLANVSAVCEDVVEALRTAGEEVEPAELPTDAGVVLEGSRVVPLPEVPLDPVAVLELDAAVVEEVAGVESVVVVLAADGEPVAPVVSP